MVLTLASGPAGHNFILLLESPAQRTGKIQLTHLPTESFIVFTSLGYIKEKSMVMLPSPSFDKRLALLESLPPFMSSLPDDPVDNIALRVQQSLAQDGTPDD